MFLLILYVLHTILVSGVLFNVILVYFTIFKTPKSIGTFSILLTVRGGADAFACFFDIFSQSRIVPSGLTLGIVSSGICKYLGDWSCFVGYSLQLHYHCYSFHLLILCFAFRYYVLIERYPKSNQLIFLMCILYFPSFFQAVFVLIDSNKPEDVRLLLRIHHPEYEMKDVIVNGHDDLRDFPCLFAYLLMLIPIFPGYMLIHVFRRKIRSKLRNAILRPEVREKHRQLTLALTVQSFIPIAFIFSAFAFLISQSKLIESPILESLILLSAVLVPVLNPILMILMVKPYRETVMRAIGIDPKEWQCVMSKDCSVAPGDSNSSMFSFDNTSVASVTSVSSKFTLTGERSPFD
uniref:G protein-coupled receptor n=2 Tax=Caenorhabditis tropicalis TaxID=1561998 RepID=A0A1I7TP57_9PELO